MKFKDYLNDNEGHYFVHVTFIKGDSKSDSKIIEDKINKAFYNLKYTEAPSSVAKVSEYKTHLSSDKYYHTIVFELNNAGKIIKLPRSNSIVIQTSNSKQKLQ